MRFYGREKELEVLERAYLHHSGGFVIISGRRRIGKSRLIDEFLKNKKALNVLVVPKEEKQVAKDFEEQIKSKFGYSPPFDSLKEVLKYAFEQDNLVICMDEFSNVLHVNKAIPFELQGLWDKYKEKKILLIVSGSYTGMMKKLFSEKKAPLFNRATNTLNLGQLPFGTVTNILNDIRVSDSTEQIQYFCLFGGVPYYYMLLEREKNKDFESVIHQLFFDTGAQLREEGENVLRQEFGNAYAKYYSLLEAISFGYVSLNDLSQQLGVRSTTITKYIKSLRQDFKLIERIVPFGQNKVKSKKGFYFITDNMLAFWFSQVYGKLSPPTKEELNTFLGKRFEMLCLNSMVSFLQKKREKVMRAGKWWGQVEISPKNFEQREIDIVIETDKVLYIGECKWIADKIGKKELDHLKQSAAPLMSGTKKQVKWLLFSKKGFNLNETHDLMLFDPAKITSLF